MSPHFHSEHARSCSHLLDGLSIPFFSAGRRTLTLTRSAVGDQPEWLNWVRRVPPQEDADRTAAASPSGIEQEGQNHVEWSLLPDTSDSIPGGARTPRKVLKFEEVCIALLSWPRLTFLIRFCLKDVRINSAQNSIASVVEEHVEITVTDEARSTRRDS